MSQGGTNYRKWDKVAVDLLEETENEEKVERGVASEALGHTRVPYSEAEAAERAKAEIARKAKEAMDAQQKRESNAICVLTDLLEQGTREVLVVGEDLVGRKRVLTLRNCRGPGTIILPAALSRLSHPARFDEDGDALDNVTGLIKVFVKVQTSHG